MGGSTALLPTCLMWLLLVVFFTLQVNSNGFISVYPAKNYRPGLIRDNNESPIIAPYSARTDTRLSGSVRFTQFTSYDRLQMTIVSEFIRSHTNHTFSGTRMMVVEWRDVAKYGGSAVSLLMCNNKYRLAANEKYKDCNFFDERWYLVFPFTRTTSSELSTHSMHLTCYCGTCVLVCFYHTEYYKYVSSGSDHQWDGLLCSVHL